MQLDNLMLKGQWPDVSLKMCDFGYSKDEAKQSVSKSTCGTPEYMAPEVLFEVRLLRGTWHKLQWGQGRAKLAVRFT